jgi:hypothetical protein
MKHFATALTLCLLSGLSLAAPLKGSVTSPEPGIICDKKGGFCADAQGISMAHTKQFLGEKAEKKLLAMGEFDMTTFTLTNGVHCEVKTQHCTVGKWSDKLDPAHTKALFGK